MEQRKRLKSYCTAVFKWRLEVLLKVKCNLQNSQRNNCQTLNGLLNTVCQSHHSICSLLFFNSITWSHVFHWELPSDGLISGPHLKILLTLDREFRSIPLTFSSENDISLSLILLISEYPLYCGTFLAVPHGWVLVMSNSYNMI